ncbi:hypothetical protein MAHJHV55_27590 [Mycobacterium avium subsp. hominissuis]
MAVGTAGDVALEAAHDAGSAGSRMRPVNGGGAWSGSNSSYGECNRPERWVHYLWWKGRRGREFRERLTVETVASRWRKG